MNQACMICIKMKVIVLYLYLLLFSACIGREREEEYPILKAPLKESKFLLTDIFDRVEVIPLETNDSCLLVFPTQVLCENGRYEVFDFDHSALFLFDKNGQFLKKVGQRGNGPQEYISVCDVVHDSRNGNICLLSPRGEIFCYSSNGDFQERRKLPVKVNYQCIEDFDDYFVTWTIPGGPDKYGVSIITKDSLQLVCEYGSGNRNLLTQNNLGALYQYDGRLYFSKWYSRKTYEVDVSGLHVAYQWDFDKANYEIEDFGFSSNKEGGREEQSRLIKDLQDGTFPYVIVLQRQNKDYYYAKLSFGSKQEGEIYYRKADGKSLFFKKTKHGSNLNPMCFNDEYVIYLSLYEDIARFENLLDEQELAKLEGRTEEDNPFLIKCYFK